MSMNDNVKNSNPSDSTTPANAGTDLATSGAMNVPPDQEPTPQLIATLKDLHARSIAPDAPPEALHEFLQGALGHVLQQPSLHWWCHHDLEPIAKNLLHLFSLDENASLLRYKDIMDNVISNCISCAQSYYTDRRDYLADLLNDYDQDVVDSFFQVLLTWDCTRISNRLRILAISPPSANLQLRRKICVCETVLDAALLLDATYCGRILPHMTTLLGIMMAKKKPLKLGSLLPGIWLLGVHGDSQIHRWAVYVNNYGASEELLGPDRWHSWEQFKIIWERILLLANGELQQAQNDFPYTKDYTHILKTQRSIVNSMTPTVLEIATKNDQWQIFQRRLLDSIMGASGEQEPHMIESCQLLFSIVVKLGKLFWTSNKAVQFKTIQEAMSLLKSVFVHPRVQELILAISAKDRQAPSEPAVVHPQGIFHDQIAWVAALVKSLSGLFEPAAIPIFTADTLLQLVSKRMDARFNHTSLSVADQEALDGFLEFDLLLLTTFQLLEGSFERNDMSIPAKTLKPHWRWLAKFYALGVDSFSLSGFPEAVAHRISALVSKAVTAGRLTALELMKLEVRTVWKNYGVAIAAVKSKSAAKLEATVPEIFLRVAQSAFIKSQSKSENRTQTTWEWQRNVIEVFSSMALIPKMETRSSYSDEVLSMCAAFNNNMDVLFNSSTILLQDLAGQEDSSLRSLLGADNKHMIATLLKFWCSPHKETLTQALAVMRAAWKEEARQSCLRHAFKVGGEQSIEEIIDILSEYRDHGCPGGATPPVLFQFLLDAVTILFLNNTTDGEGGLYLQIFLDLTSSSEVTRHLALVKELWNAIWQSLNAAFEAGATTWHTQQARSETISTMRILADVGLLIIGKIEYFEHLLEFEKQDLESDTLDMDQALDQSMDIFSQLSLSQSTPRSLKETMPLEYLEAGLPRLAPWMYAQDFSLCSAALKLTCAVLNLLADKGRSIKFPNNERLVKIAAGDKDISLLLTTDQSARLEDALGRHADYFDESLGYRPLEESTPSVPVKIESATKETTQGQSAQWPSSSAVETIEISDDDFADLEGVDLDDMDFDDVKAPQPPVSLPVMKPALKPDSMRRLTGSTQRTFQTKLDFASAPPPTTPTVGATTAGSSLTSLAPRRLPPSLNRFNMSATPKPSPKTAPSKKSTSKLGQMRADHVRERSNIVSATKQARTASRYKQAVNKLPEKIVTSVRSGSASESESDNDSDDGDNGLSSLVDAEEKFLSLNKPAKTEPRKTKLLELNEVMGPKFVDTIALKRQIKLDEARRMQRLMPNLGGLHAQLLQWEVSATGDRPPNSKECSSIPSTFVSVESYVKTFEPLLVLECWAQFLSSKEEANQSSDSVTAMVVNRVSVDKFQDIHMVMPKESAGSINVEDVVVVSDLLIKDVFSATGNAARSKPFLAKVQSITWVKGAECEVVMRTCLKIEESSALMSVIPKSRWNILKLMNLTPIHREYAALIALRYYELCETILSPPKEVMHKPSEAMLRSIMDTYKVNTPQAQAIAGAVEKANGFTLIQGPPGTGKTKTILGLVGALLADGARARVAPTVFSSKSGERPLQTGTVSRMLVCAPSNAAIDEIVKRLKGGIRNSEGVMFIPKIVRVGNLDSVNAEAKDVVLETLIAKELELASAAKDDFRLTAQTISSLLDRMRKIGEDIEKARLELVNAKEEGSPTLVADAEAKIRALRHEKWKVGQDLNLARSDQAENAQKKDQARKNARDKILGEADVICSTLSASGHELLTNNSFSFETVIIDEAAQSVEVSSLIPLKYGCKRCILVGDPNQLPPTVKSQVATKYLYNQSLFVRIQDLSPSSVHLLSIQYRMHPSISAFPSREFYKSLLKDGPDMAAKTKAEWHKNPLWSPYRFFDVHEGREKIGLSHSQHNPIEAEAAVELLEKLCNSNPSLNFFRRVGVISPYQQQVRTLKEYFTRRFGSKILESIDFNSVDGFQGQEKDIIIFSCVRASATGTVGFLADIRRMNVALTRARQSLFILGHAATLRREMIWGDLVQDAEDRGLFTRVDPGVFGPRSLSAQPKNLLEPRPAGDRRNIHGKVSDSLMATVIDTPMTEAVDIDMDDGFSYPSLPETKVAPEPPRRLRPSEKDVSGRDGRNIPGSGNGQRTPHGQKRGPEERPRLDPKKFVAMSEEEPTSPKSPLSPITTGMTTMVVASSSSSRAAQGMPPRPPSPKRLKKGPNLFMKSKPMAMKNLGPPIGTHNAVPLRDRLAASVAPIRKSYPSGPSAANAAVSRGPSKKSTGPSLDDLLNQMQK
ncbi:DEAD-box type RNA helicase [Podila epigama]|nr:DEAD-box type RNA helicase [Podila epigama]